MLLSVLEMLLHTRMGGEVAKFRREKRCPLHCPSLPFPPFTHPYPSLVGQVSVSLHKRDEQRFQGTCRSLGGHGGAKAGSACVS